MSDFEVCDLRGFSKLRFWLIATEDFVQVELNSYFRELGQVAAVCSKT